MITTLLDIYPHVWRLIYTINPTFTAASLGTKNQSMIKRMKQFALKIKSRQRQVLYIYCHHCYLWYYQQLRPLMAKNVVVSAQQQNIT